MMTSYLSNMSANYSNWMMNTIKQEKEDWCSDRDPEMDLDQFYHTSSPVIIYQMVDENLQVSATISQELVHRYVQYAVYATKEASTQTIQLNDFSAEIVEKHPPPRRAGPALKNLF